MANPERLGLAAFCLTQSINAATSSVISDVLLTGRLTPRLLTWLGSELERLASEAYRLADEAGDDEAPVDWSKPIPGFDEPPKSS